MANFDISTSVDLNLFTCQWFGISIKQYSKYFSTLEQHFLFRYYRISEVLYCPMLRKRMNFELHLQKTHFRFNSEFWFRKMIRKRYLRPFCVFMQSRVVIHWLLARTNEYFYLFRSNIVTCTVNTWLFVKMEAKIVKLIHWLLVKPIANKAKLVSLFQKTRKWSKKFSF